MVVRDRPRKQVTEEIGSVELFRPTHQYVLGFAEVRKQDPRLCEWPCPDLEDLVVINTGVEESKRSFDAVQVSCVWQVAPKSISKSLSPPLRTSLS